MRRATLLVGLVAGGCVYLNTLYNAGAAWDRAEDARLRALPESARSAYTRALEGAAESFRRDSLGPWALPSLLLAGKAQLRLGNPAQAAPLLERVALTSGDSAVVAEAHLYLGASRWLAGDTDGALEGLNLALFELEDRRLRGEAHLWRGRVLLSRGLAGQGYWDLARAGESDGSLRVPAALERMAFAVERGTPEEARAGLSVVLGQSAAGVWSDSVSHLLDRARDRWGPEVAAGLLATGGTSRWIPERRTALAVQRARFLREAGDNDGARAVLADAVRDGGPLAPRARLAMARQIAASAATSDDLLPIQGILAPDREVPELDDYSTAAATLQLLAGSRPASFPGLFAAGELARDALGAPVLATHLFFRAAGEDDARRWAGKAWLAARALHPRGDGGAPPPAGMEELRRALIRTRDPYLAAARNRYLPSDTLAALDRALQMRLDSALAWATEVARRRGSDAPSPGAR